MGTTNTLDLNNRVDKLEKAVSGGDSAQANKKDIATEFSTTTNYTAGCFVYYDGKLYQFNADHSAGAWDPTDVVVANVTDQIVSNKSAIDGLSAADITYDNTDSGLTATDVQGALDELRHADNVMMSDGTTSVEDALDGVVSGISKIYTSNNIAGNGTMTFNMKKSYCHMIFSTRNNAISMIAYGNLIDMVNQSNLTVTILYAADHDEISITNNNVSSTNIVLI